MNVQRKPLILAVLAAAVLGACGGGGSDAGGSLYGGGGDTTTATGDAAAIAAVKSLEITPYEGSSLNALTGSVLSGTENVSLVGKAVLRIVAKDASNGTVTGVPIKMVLGGNGTYSIGTVVMGASTSSTASGLSGQATSTLTRGTKTDASGSILAIVDSGSDMSNRTISAFAQVNGSSVQSGKVSIGFSGTSISSPVVSPSTLSKGTTTNTAIYTVTNGAGATIAGTQASFSVDGGSVQSAKTDSNGKVTFTFATPASANSMTLSANALGAESTQVLALSQAATATAAQTDFGGAYLTPGSTVISANSASADSNQVSLNAIIQDKNNKPLPGVLVGFSLDPASNYSGGQFFTGTSVLTSQIATNADGAVTASFRPGAATTSKDGLVIRACYWFAGQSPGTCLPGQVTSVPLTVVNKPVSLSIAPPSVITVDAADTNWYRRVYAVQVTNAQGALMTNASVTPRIEYRGFAKGYMARASGAPQWDYALPKLWCSVKDANGDNVIQAQEDFDGSGSLFPRAADISVEPKQGTTDSRGMVTFTVRYPRAVAGWVEYALVASTSVSGTESKTQYREVAALLLDDRKAEVTPAFQSSPYVGWRDAAPGPYSGMKRSTVTLSTLTATNVEATGVSVTGPVLDGVAQASATDATLSAGTVVNGVITDGVLTVGTDTKVSSQITGGRLTAGSIDQGIVSEGQRAGVFASDGVTPEVVSSNSVIMKGLKYSSIYAACRPQIPY